MNRFSSDRPARVLVVDDSALMRQVLSAIIDSDPALCVVDTAIDPLMARDKIKQHNPDVITLDVEMPRMNGLDFLHRLMTLRPTPVVMISSLTQSGADASLRALEAGAVDVIGKPVSGGAGLMELRDEIVAKIKAAAVSRVGAVVATASTRRLEGRLFTRGAIVAVGASTGGVPAVQAIVQAMPRSAPPLVVVQHMPAGFTARLAQRLDGLSAVVVSEALDGEPLLPGYAYIAPGGFMTRVERAGEGYRLRVTAEPRVNGFCPSVDVLFHSVAESAGKSAMGVILTGMGRDGAEGLLALRRAGGATLGQDETSCVVYGMPRAACELGAVERELPLSKIPQAIVDACARTGTEGAFHVFL